MTKHAHTSKGLRKSVSYQQISIVIFVIHCPEKMLILVTFLDRSVSLICCDLGHTYCIYAGGFYSTKLNDKILLVGLNTNLYYDSNQLTASMPDPGNQLQWLDDTLTQANATGLKVYVYH